MTFKPGMAFETVKSHEASVKQLFELSAKPKTDGVDVSDVVPAALVGSRGPSTGNGKGA